MKNLKSKLKILCYFKGFVFISGNAFSQYTIPLPECNCCPTVYSCGGSTTQVVEVINPLTGKTWMDRNLGASQVATNSLDNAAFGDLYQWGRSCDGHQLRTSDTTNIQATTVVPNLGNPWDGKFITTPPWPAPDSWLITPQDSLWQGINGINNPCPPCYRIPTASEIQNEINSWATFNAAGAFASPLKFTMGGVRVSVLGGEIQEYGPSAHYWSSTVLPNPSNPNFSAWFYFDNYSANVAFGAERGRGHSVRCIKN